MKQETDKLHEEYYKKFGRLYSNQKLLSPEIFKEIEENLLEEYRTEYLIIKLRDDSENERTIYELQTRNAWIIPRFFRRFIFWKRPNQAADQINRQLAVEMTDYFNKRERALERLIAALEEQQTDMDECSETQTASDETAVEQVEQHDEQPKPRRRRRHSAENEQVPGQIEIEMPDNDDPGETDE